MTGKTVGYIRVSSIDQNEARQLEGVELDKVFIDKTSGKNMSRPQLQACLDYLRDGDTLVVHSMDRLARSTIDMLTIVRDLTARQVKVRFIKENQTYTGDDSPMAMLLLGQMAAFAEFERAIIRERQREGIAIAKAKGVYKGRKPALSADQVADLKTRAASGEKKAELARQFKISRATLYEYLAA